MGRPVAYIVVISYLAQDQLNDYMTYPDLQLTEVLTTISSTHPVNKTPPDGVPKTGTSDSTGIFMDNLYAGDGSNPIPAGFFSATDQALDVEGF